MVKIYEGDASFFIKHFSEDYTNKDILQWHTWLYHHLSSLVLFCIVPIFIIKVFLKDDLGNYGIGLGDVRFGLSATLVAIIILPILVYQNSLNPHHAEFYQTHFPLLLVNSSPYYFSLWALTYLPHYLGWEFFFRGYVGFGFKKYHGAFMAIMFQTLLTAMMHIGKPESETWSTVVGGVYLGLLAYRSNSIWYGVLFHLYLGLLNTWFCGL